MHWVDIILLYLRKFLPGYLSYFILHTYYYNNIVQRCFVPILINHYSYGQTGSGKTFTITGGPERYDDRGLIPRSLAYLFKSIKNDEKNGTSYSCYISYLEIYNEYGYDLLQESMKNKNISSFGEVEVPKVTMLEDEDGNFYFKNLSMHLVTTEEDALNLLFLGDTNRAIAATEMNQNSTRSHCIFSIVLEKRMAGADTVTRSKMNIVDLAGSERVSRSNSAGQTLREAKYINSSLFFLEMVIVALHEKEKKRKDVHSKLCLIDILYIGTAAAHSHLLNVAASSI